MWSDWPGAPLADHLTDTHIKHKSLYSGSIAIDAIVNDVKGALLIADVIATKLVVPPCHKAGEQAVVTKRTLALAVRLTAHE